MQGIEMPHIVLLQGNLIIFIYKLEIHLLLTGCKNANCRYVSHCVSTRLSRVMFIKGHESSAMHSESFHVYEI
ncbi:hypothetical protein V6N12_038619 [Hibiscus sabdariffa]|uniref:Uncharacterized protein n=1 Tax=Hibiscus sabdariffa TaxID=183260 RepID=A0ABR2AIN3_9ROSI